MKSLLALVFTFAFVYTSALAADECCADPAAAVQQRVREIDIKISLFKYEQIEMERAKAEIQLALLDEDGSDTERKALHRRVDYLARVATEVRERMAKLTEAVSIAAK